MPAATFHHNLRESEPRSGSTVITGSTAAFYYGLYRSFQLTDEPIPPPRQSLDKARALSRVAQHFANLVDGGVQVVIDVDKRVRPEPLLQFLPRDYVSRTLQQNGQDLKRLATELELHSGLAQLAGSKINFECLETNQIGGSESLLHDSDTAIAQF